MPITQQQKDAALAKIEEKARIADEVGLKATAQSWRDLHSALSARPCLTIIFAESIGAQPTE